MKRLGVAAAVATVALAVAPAAFPGAPTITRTPVPIALEDDTDCGFPVYIEGTGTDVNISWTLADGTARSVDAFTNAKATVTNLDTGKSVTVNDAGSGHATFTANGATFISTGPAFIFNFSGLPGIHWVAGRFVLSVDATGAHLQILGGTVRDLCAAVAP